MQLFIEELILPAREIPATCYALPVAGNRTASNFSEGIIFPAAPLSGNFHRARSRFTRVPLSADLVVQPRGVVIDDYVYVHFIVKLASFSIKSSLLQRGYIVGSLKF